MSKNKKTIIAAVTLLVLIVAAVVCIKIFAPATETGTKSVTITVIDNNGEHVTYSVNADVEYLRQAMEEADGLEFSGEEAQYGMMVENVNGLKAVYAEDNAYWAFYKDTNGNGEPDGDEYCMHGIETEPVAAGDIFLIVFENAK